jgi:pimeloyl-ACP methyl ester carboxylesterase
VWNNRFVVGPSWGTLVALATQSGRPNTAGLVLLSGYYFPTFRIDALMIAPGAGDDFSGRHRMAERLIASAPG